MSNEEDFLEFMKTKREADKREKEADAKFGEPIKVNMKKFKESLINFIVLTIQHSEFTRKNRENPLTDNELIFCVLRIFEEVQTPSTKADFIGDVMAKYRKIEFTGNVPLTASISSNGAPAVV